MPAKSRRPNEHVQRTHQQSQEPAHYKYQPLQTLESIRLLELEPGHENDIIRCWLFEVRLHDRPSFEAISYAWGDLNSKDGILCNEKTISVTHNLMDALRVFRRTDRPRILWADAVCINQMDERERGVQVQLMARIYSDATKVLIWLGHGDFFMIQVAFNYICHVNRYKERSDSNECHATYHWKGREVDMRNSGAVAPDASLGEIRLLALSYLFARPYFRRGWIVQEVVLPNSARIFWGEAQLDLHWLCEIISDLRWLHNTLFRGSARVGLGSADHIRTLRRSAHDNPKKYPFTKLLIYTGNQQFSDSKDYIYGLLGLQRICYEMSSRRPLFQPDYSTSDMECFKTVVETLMIECGDVGIISLVQHEYVIEEDWPSWLPHLDGKFSAESFYYRRRASGYLRASVSKQVFEDVEYIRIRGIRVGSIHSVVHSAARDEYDFRPLFRQLQVRHGADSVACTVTSGTNHDGRCVSDGTATHSLHVEDYTAYIAQDIEDPEPTTRPRESLFRAAGFGRVCAKKLYLASLFETHEGHLGCVEGPVEVGDQVVVFFGGRMPFVLRPVGERWRLLGVCYVHGIMEGEAVENWKRSGKATEEFDLY